MRLFTDFFLLSLNLELKSTWKITLRNAVWHYCWRKWNIENLKQRFATTTPLLYKTFTQYLMLKFVKIEDSKSPVNSFHATELFSCPLKTSENYRFSDVFRTSQRRSLAWNGLRRVFWVEKGWVLQSYL